MLWTSLFCKVYHLHINHHMNSFTCAELQSTQMLLRCVDTEVNVWDNPTTSFNTICSHLILSSCYIVNNNLQYKRYIFLSDNILNNFHWLTLSKALSAFIIGPWTLELLFISYKCIWLENAACNLTLHVHWIYFYFLFSPTNSCHVTSRHVTSRHVISCHVMYTAAPLHVCDHVILFTVYWQAL